ncbi:helix-turn-helix domain-containing protein [Candidatus Woesearchaeota archaeon]|nr:helix-turn-helix domain-containing protein [Candidatus Woesearchaeota archaeon]
MAPKISEETVKLIEILYAQDLSPREIAQRAEVSRSTVYVHTKLKERGFLSKREYERHLAQEKGFASSGEYHSFLAQEQGFTSRTEYNGHLLLERGFTSKAEYEQYLAQQNGFLSLGDYQKKMAEKRQQRHLNKELSSLIVKRLAELGQTQKWLAEQLNLTKGTISKYINASLIPKQNLLGRLFQALEVPYKTIDDLLE